MAPYSMGELIGIVSKSVSLERSSILYILFLEGSAPQWYMKCDTQYQKTHSHIHTYTHKHTETQTHIHMPHYLEREGHTHIHIHSHEHT